MGVLLLERILWSIKSHVFEHTSNNIKHQKEIHQGIHNGYLWMTELRMILIFFIFLNFSWAKPVFLY